jgi:hypothetical protein
VARVQAYSTVTCVPFCIFLKFSKAIYKLNAAVTKPNNALSDFTVLPFIVQVFSIESLIKNPASEVTGAGF